MNDRLVLEKRHAYKYQNGPIFFYDPFHTTIILPTGKQSVLYGGVTLSDVMNGIEKYARAYQTGKKQVATLFLLAGTHKRNRPERAYFESVTDWQLDNFVLELAQGVYTKEDFSIWFYGTGKSFGEQKNLPAIREAYYRLEKQLGVTFNQEHFTLCTTPSQTGKELISVSLPVNERYLCLPDDLQEVIRENSPQGRKELFITRTGETLETLYILDARFMYASCCDALPTGEPIRDNDSEFYGKASTTTGFLYPASPGFYRVHVTVPSTWQHIGLLRSGKGRGNRPERAYYPNKPGETFETWTTANELSLALNNGWNIHIIERILFPHPQTDPLASWLKKLRALYEQFKQGESELDALMAVYLRQVVLHTIGSFDSNYAIKKHLSPFGKAEWKGKSVHRELDGKLAFREIPGKGVFWKEDIPLSGRARIWMHPEWCATAWGRARTRLSMFALSLPFRDIIAFDTDCVYSTSLPDSATCKLWVPENGKPGTFRQKGETVHSFVVPGNWKGMQDWIEARSLQRIDAVFFTDDTIQESE